MENYGYVYLITNKINNKKYVGMRASSTFDDFYWGSGKVIKNAINKYGTNSFERSILHWCATATELSDTEYDELQNRNVAESDEYYNIIASKTPILFGEDNGFYGKKHTSATKKLISKKLSGRVRSPEEQQKRNEYWDTEAGILRKELLSKERSQWTLSEEHKNKISNSLKKKSDIISKQKKEFYQTHKGKKLREILAISAKERFSGVPKTQEHRKKISDALVGISRRNPQNTDPEKIRKTAEKHKGMKRSAEAKKKMSLAAKARGPNNKGCFYIHSASTLEVKMLKKGEVIPEGYRKGYGRRKK
ncbi:MAG: hypothetical protein HOK52_00625 [Candidatus Marinimicrobia bacterium]|jgi:hypothetical protein|nr:hypothetical protein [Candidatus Neomarinimicrobiota bacterium]